MKISLSSIIQRSKQRLGLSYLVGGEAEDKRLLLESGLFDADYYLSQSPDVLTAGFDPAIHYLRHGGREGRNPSIKFDTQFYFSANPDVAVQDINPLIHYLKYGRYEGRQIRRLPAPATRPEAPPDGLWDQLELQTLASATDEATLDVIIPVYRGFDETANCLLTVIKSRAVNTTKFEIVVINDSTPEAALEVLLNKLESLKLITLIRNKENVGFVGSVNSGMALHEDRDVILLNSDTEVYGNWAERLHRAAYSEATIGTVTPFSNNATICSYPHFVKDFDAAFEIPFEAIDRLASKANAGLTVDIPTAVGFCMYIRRQCLRDVGLFDEKTFKRGYGEENDFCMRINARGWRNVLAGDIFVRHLGRVSFAETAPSAIAKALEIIDVKYPNYHREIAEYVKEDAPRQLRYNIDIARLKNVTGHRAFLFIMHKLGGGTAKHARELAALLRKEGIGTYFLFPADNDPDHAELSHPAVNHLSVVRMLDIKHGLASSVELLRDLNILHIHIHHMLGYDSQIGEFARIVARECEIEYDFTVHDYFSVCPRLDMIDETNAFCRNTDLAVCEKCVDNNGSLAGDVSVWLWREDYARILNGARKVFVPNVDVQVHINSFLPSLPITVRPHFEIIPKNLLTAPVRRPGSALNVGIIGAVGMRKGSAVLKALAKDALRRRLNIKYTLFGFADDPEIATLRNVNITGGYFEPDLPGMITRAQCHLSIFPAVWPETYSYTLSQAIIYGLYPVAFDLGAIAQRIRALGWGHILPFDWITEPARVNDALLALVPNPRPDDLSPAIAAAQPGKILSDYYELGLPAEAPSYPQLLSPL